MRNAALALLSLLVLGLLAANTRFRSGHELLEGRIAAAEKKARPKPAIVRETPLQAPLPAPAPPPPASVAPSPAAATTSLAVAELPYSVASRAQIEYLTVDRQLDLALVGYIPDPTAELELTEPQKLMMESLKQTRDAELQPFKDKIREIELRYEDEMQRLLTPEQYRQYVLQKQTIQPGNLVYWRAQTEVTPPPK